MNRINEALSVGISLAVVVLTIVLFSSPLIAAPADDGWTVYRTFEYNIFLWEREPRENFKEYAITNESGATMCMIPYVHGNPKTRSGLQIVNLLKPGSFHELGFVTYTTGSNPGSAMWAVTLILLENHCSWGKPSPQLPDPPLPLS